MNLRLLFASLSILVLVQAISPASGQGESLTKAPSRKIPLRFDKADVDGQIIALARAEDTNFVADASRFAHFPQDAELLSDNSTNFFISHLLILAHQRHLTWAKVGEGSNDRGTFVLWSDQDIVPIAQGTLKVPVTWVDEKIRDQEWVAAATAERPMDYMDNSEIIIERTRVVGPMLAEYLKKEQGWDGKTTNFKKQIPVINLPQPLRNDLLARLQALAFLPIRVKGDEVFFDDAFWKNAKLGVYKFLAARNPGQPQTSLQIIGSADGIVRGATFGWIDMSGTGVRFGQLPVGGRVLNFASYRTSLQSGPRKVSSLQQVGLDTQQEVPVQVQSPPLPATRDAQTGVGEVNLLQNDALLHGKVSLEVKRKPLSEVLRIVAQQGKVALDVGDGALPTSPVTARIHDLSLAETMQALARLYGAKWQKMGNATYQLQKSGKSETAIKVDQLGDFGKYHYWYREMFFDRAPQQLHLPPPVNWAEEVLPYIPDPSQLRTGGKPDKGVSLVTLPPELQTKIRQTVLNSVSESLVRNYLSLTTENLFKATLMVNLKPPPVGGGLAELPYIAVGAPSYTAVELDVKTFLALASEPEPAPATPQEKKEE